MTQPSSPVYQRIARAGRAPSHVAALWITCALMLVAFATVAVLDLMSIDNPYSQTAGHLISLTVILAWVVELLCPAITLMTGAAITTQQARSEEMALLRLTHLSGADILDGFTRGVRRRLRPVRAVCLGIGLGVMLATVMSGLIQTARWQDNLLYLRLSNTDGILSSLLLQAWLVIAIRAAGGLGVALGAYGRPGVIASGGLAAALLILPALMVLDAASSPSFGARAAAFAAGMAILLAAVLIAQWAVTRAAARAIETTQEVTV